MSHKTARTMIEIWERARHAIPVDRALMILSAANPQYSQDDVAAWTIGTRDRHLLRLREDWFGATARCMDRCPVCAQSLEFDLDVRQFRTEGERSFQLTHQSIYNEEPYEIAFRLPDSRDMAALAACTELGQAKALLLDRCVLQASRQAQDVPWDALPPHVLDEVEAAIARAEPEAEILLDLTCPDCQASWQTVFDIGSYLWTEIAHEARRSLWEVHALARAYGWAESAIVEMSEARRRWYLEAVTA